jgi:NADH-quinone oxidoreductase subunit E
LNKEDKIEFSAETLELVSRIIARYPEGRQKSALIPVLHVAQAEFDGWLSVAVMDYIASLLGILPIEVYEVATFYTMFHTKPVGNCIIEVCRTGPCWLAGAEEIIAHLENIMGIKVGETTPDGRFTLEEVECLANCGNAPVIHVGWAMHENMTPEKAQKMVEFWPKNISCHENPFKGILDKATVK